MKKYYNHVFKNGNSEYITECQLSGSGPLAVDIDLRYQTDITSRIHNLAHIYDLITIYCEQLSDNLKIVHDKPIPIYIFEKPNDFAYGLALTLIFLLIGGAILVPIVQYFITL